MDTLRHEDNQRRLTEVEAAVALLVARLDTVAVDVHALKGNMAGNTHMTQETLAGVDAIKALIGQLDISSLRDMADAMNSMKGGVKVLGWLERPAKWLLTMSALATAIYGLWKLK
jgi:hypothetical protein